MEGLETRVLEMAPENALNLPLPFNTDFMFLTQPLAEPGSGTVVLKLFLDTPEIWFSQSQGIIGLQLAEQSISLDSSGKADLGANEKARTVVEARKSLSERKAEVGVYAKRGAQLTLPEWPGVASGLTVWLMHPGEQRGRFPLYVTLNRKQLDLGKRESFSPGSQSELWNSYSIPLSFPRQALLERRLALFVVDNSITSASSRNQLHRDEWKSQRNPHTSSIISSRGNLSGPHPA